MKPIARVPLAVDEAPGGETSTHVLGTDDALVVDPAVQSAALTRDSERRGVTHVAVTHAHPDHVGAVARYADVQDATVWARAGHEDRFERATGVAPDRTVREGATIDTASGPVTVVETPGHAPDHVGFALDDAVVVGDLAVESGSVAVAAPEGDLRAYRVSLRRLYARDPDRLYPAHGPVIEDPRATLSRLLAHRRDREARVLAAVDSGARTVSAITDAAYEKDVGGVRDLAEGTVRAHLEALAVAGEVDWDDERAVPE